jgi:ribosomal protein S12 methylthiotransferase accessory factor
VTAKAFTDGTHRAVAPDETVRRLLGWLDHFGITRVADITGLDRLGIPVMAAYRPDAWSLAVSMGKGTTPDAARASALMESIELWHAERPTLDLQWGTAAGLGVDHRLIDWTGLAFAPGCTFDTSVETSWALATSLVDGNSLLVPYEAVHTEGRDPEPPGSGWFANTSNGLASGNTLSEALLHALCEVIERDAATLFRLSSDPGRRAVDVSTVTDPSCLALLASVDAAGLAALVHDMTSDVGVPAVSCTLFEPGRDSTQYVYASTGMGCHPAPAVALSRAVTEAAQSRLTLISGARDDMFRARYDPLADAEARAESLTAQWEAARTAPRSFADLPDVAGATIEDDVDTVVGAIAGRGLHPCWVDLSQPDIGIAVVRAVVAGLEHLVEVPGYAPGPRARAVLAGAPS